MGQRSRIGPGDCLVERRRHPGLCRLDRIFCSEGQTAHAANSRLVTAESTVLAANPRTNLTNGLAGSRMLAERTRCDQDSWRRLGCAAAIGSFVRAFRHPRRAELRPESRALGLCANRKFAQPETFRFDLRLISREPPLTDKEAHREPV